MTRKILRCWTFQSSNAEPICTRLSYLRHKFRHQVNGCCFDKYITLLLKGELEDIPRENNVLLIFRGEKGNLSILN